jgi:ferric-dicitrate binding protein FerR (iron transport regulator)
MNHLETIHKLLANELSEAERTTFWQELKDNKELEELYYQQKNLWVKTGFSTVLSEQEQVQDFQTIWRKTGESRKFYFRNIFKYAAVFILASLLGGGLNYVWYRTKSDEASVKLYSFSAGPQSNSQVTLPDGSTIELNANTKLTFKQDVEQNKRLVTLEGEAWFKVIHDEKHPFIIDFGELEIVDVGTVFNVKAIKGSGFIETTLQEGLVDLIVNKQDVTNLLPGEQARYLLANGQMKVKKADPDASVAWRNNRFVFKNETLRTILHEMGNWYNVDIQWDNADVMNKRLYYNSERSIQLEEALGRLSMSTPFKYKVVEQNSKVERIILY